MKVGEEEDDDVAPDWPTSFLIAVSQRAGFLDREAIAAEFFLTVKLIQHSKFILSLKGTQRDAISPRPSTHNLLA